MGFINDEARKNNKYNGSELYDKYLDDEKNGRRHSLTRMTQYSQCYYLCLTPKYKRVKRFTCDNCFSKDDKPNKYPCHTKRKQSMGCVRGIPLDDYYDVSGHLFSEIFKIKEGEYWIRYNKEAHKLWQNVYTSREAGINARPVWSGYITGFGGLD